MTELNRIQFIREEKGLTLRKIGKISGVNHTTISRIENGFTNPSQITMVKISKALKMEVNEVFNLDWKKIILYGK